MNPEAGRQIQRRGSWRKLGSPLRAGWHSVEGLGNIIFVSQRHIELAGQHDDDCIVTLVLGSANPGIQEWIIWKIEPAATAPAVTALAVTALAETEPAGAGPVDPGESQAPAGSVE